MQTLTPNIDVPAGLKDPNHHDSQPSKVSVLIRVNIYATNGKDNP